MATHNISWLANCLSHVLQDGSLVVPAYLDAMSQAQHGMTSHLNPQTGLSPSGNPQMHHGLQHSLQQEDDEQYDDDADEPSREEEEGTGEQGMLSEVLPMAIKLDAATQMLLAAIVCWSGYNNSPCAIKATWICAFKVQFLLSSLWRTSLPNRWLQHSLPKYNLHHGRDELLNDTIAHDLLHQDELLLLKFEKLWILVCKVKAECAGCLLRWSALFVAFCQG